MTNKDSTPILINLVGLHPRNIFTKHEGNPLGDFREKDKM